jgi:hypothetical protein
MNRPEPAWKAPEGYEHVAVADGEWRIETHRLCRMTIRGRQCAKPSAAALLRGQKQQTWWAYCPDHMYGRWVESGQVMRWILRRAGEAS